MTRKGWRRLGVALGTLLLALLVGCQAVGGLDLTSMIVKQLSVESGESSSSIDIQLDWDKDALAKEDPEAAKIEDLFSQIKLQIDHAVVGKDGQISMEGQLGLAGGAIPFSLIKGTNAFVMRVEGIDQPLVIETSEAEGLFLNSTASGENTADVDAYQELLRKIGTEAASYFVGHLPNPPVINVAQVSEPVHGENVSLTKVHAELNGRQLGELVPQFLDALAKDEDGVRQLMQRVAQLIGELPPEALQSMGLAEEDGGLPTEEDINAAVEELLSTFAEARDQVTKAQSEPEWNQIFTDNVSFVTDLYVDRDLYIRKSDTKIVLDAGLFADSEIPLKGASINVSREYWNVNADVQVPAANVPANALNIEDISALEPYQALRLVDKNSVLYDLLKNKLQVDDQEFTIGSEESQPYIKDKNGDIYVPIANTLDRFGIYKSAFLPQGKYIQFRDEALQQTLQLQIGTNAAKVNGVPLKLKHAVRVVNGAGYVNADDQLVVTRDL